MVRAWFKYGFSEEDRDLYRKDKRDGFVDFDPEDLDYTIGLKEISCRDRQIRTLSVTHYGKNGNVLDSFNFKERSMAKWRDIVPGSVAEGYFKTLCREP
jgi:hypothetical protein